MNKESLIVTGFACPAESWKSLFPNSTIVTLMDLIQSEISPNLFNLANEVSQKINMFKPKILICHDFGVTLSILAVLRNKRKNYYTPEKIILFNGAFRKFNVFKNKHPILVQVLTENQIRNKITKSGGHIDSRISIFLPSIRSLYRQIAIGSIIQLFKKRKNKAYILGIPILLIVSENDNFIDYQTFESISNDFDHVHIYRTKYGHFPYNHPDFSIIQKKIDQFVNETEHIENLKDD